MVGGLYQINNPFNSAMAGMAQAAGSYGAMGQERKTEYKPPDKSIGGAMFAIGKGITVKVISLE